MEKANAKKFEMQVESIEEVKFDDVKKSFAGLANREDIQLDPDLMYAKFIMCHEGVNANGDTFTKEVLQKARYTPRFKPIDWEHGQPFIGTILDSQYSETEDGVGYIEAIGAIWKFHYPDLADSIKAKSQDGGLKLSMECFYKDANYKYGEQIFSQEQADALGLTDYVGRSYMGNTVYRVFSDVIFGGVGVVANPADKEAVFLSVAKKQAESEEVDLAVAEFTRNTNDFNNKVITQDNFNAVTIAKYTKAFDKAKSSIVSKFNKKEVATKEQVLLDIKSVVNNLLNECASISNDYYKGLAEDLDLTNFDTYPTDEDADKKDDLNGLSDDEDKEELKMEQKASQEELEALAKKGLPDGGNKEDEAEAGKISEKDMINHDGQDPKASKNDPDNDGDDDSNDPTDKNDKSKADDEEDAEASKSKKNVKIKENHNQMEVKASEKIAELESALATMTAKFDALMEKVQASEKKVIASNRIAELAELGIEFSEARKAKEVEKVSAMNQADFEDYKSFLSEIAGTKTDKAEASVVVEEVTVEDVDTASAGLNVETEAPKLIKPFGHLAD